MAITLLVFFLTIQKMVAFGGGGNLIAATMTLGPVTFLTFSDLNVGQFYQLQQRQAWYWTNSTVSFTATNAVFTQMVTGNGQGGNYRLAVPPLPTQAFAVAQVINGYVVGATITDGGSGYTNPPAINIVRGSGTNAVAIAQISSAGSVTNIIFTNYGAGYLKPLIEIAPPPAEAVLPSAWSPVKLSITNTGTYTTILQNQTILGTGWQNYYTLPPQTGTNFYFTNDAEFFRLGFVP